MTYGRAKRTIRQSGADCRTVRIGAGKRWDLGIYGPDAQSIAHQLEAMDWVRLPLGRGTPLDPIVMRCPSVWADAGRAA
jgi:hypothetical protein